MLEDFTSIAAMTSSDRQQQQSVCISRLIGLYYQLVMIVHWCTVIAGLNQTASFENPLLSIVIHKYSLWITSMFWVQAMLQEISGIPGQALPDLSLSFLRY